MPRALFSYSREDSFGYIPHFQSSVLHGRPSQVHLARQNVRCSWKYSYRIQYHSKGEAPFYLHQSHWQSRVSLESVLSRFRRLPGPLHRSFCIHDIRSRQTKLSYHIKIPPAIYDSAPPESIAAAV